MSSVSESAAPEEQRPAVERARPGFRSVDQQVLSGVYEAHRCEVLGFLVGMTHDVDAAEDLLQETFVTLIREARAGRMPDDVRPWLYRVAANAAISRHRRAASWTRLLPRLLDRRQPEPPEGETLRHERDAELHAALARLRPEARASLLLAAQGFSGREVAVAIGRSESATRTLLCRGRVELRRLVEAAEDRP